MFLVNSPVAILAAMTTTRLKEAGWADVIDGAVILFGPHDTHVYDYEEFVKGAQKALEERWPLCDLRSTA